MPRLPKNNTNEHVEGAPFGASAYVHHKCRCPKCVSAYQALGRNARERRLNAPTPLHVHGSWNGYTTYGCRCEKCLDACREKYEYGKAWRKTNRTYLRDKKREERAKKAKKISEGESG